MHSWYDYHMTGERLLKVLGKDRIVEDIGPVDFEKLRADYGNSKWGPVRISGEITRTRIIFRYGYENALVEKPVRFGPGFKRADRKTLRKNRAKDRQQHGARMFTVEELHRILEAAPQPMKSMVLLGINGGMNNMDVATIPIRSVDLERGMVDFPRGKTGVPRRTPLWPETVASIKEYLAARPQPRKEEHKHLLFLTKQRNAWYRLGRWVETKNGVTIKGINNPVSNQFRAFLKKIGIDGKRGFLALRRSFRTVGRGARDREAIDALMGHRTYKDC